MQGSVDLFDVTVHGEADVERHGLTQGDVGADALCPLNLRQPDEPIYVSLERLPTGIGRTTYTALWLS